MAVALEFGVITTTFFAPPVPAGATAVTTVAETITTLVAATPPIVTLVTVDKLVPRIVIAVPPAAGPKLGVTDEMIGASSDVDKCFLYGKDRSDSGSVAGEDGK